MFSYRDEDGSTVVDVVIGSTLIISPNDTNPLKSQLNKALKQIAEEGQLEDLDVDFSGSTVVRDSEGLFKLRRIIYSIYNCTIL